ncbi:MAG: protein kinase, partial [Myxococcota bacterium]|nr:protein kinase [Myxococcota bacterium]
GKGLIHRDLKPGNVLLQTESGVHTPRITDFGFVKVLRGDTDLDLSVTRPGIQLGTPRYMAPEQATDARRVDQRADVYSLGAVLYELVTGQKAFPTADAGFVGLEESKRRDRYIPPHELRPQMPPRWQRAIEGALRADPTARVASASELLALWQGQNPASSVAAAGPVAAPERPASTPLPGAAGLRRGLTGAGIVAAGVVGTLLAWRAGTVELPDVTPAGASAVPARPVVKPTARVPEPESRPVPSARPTAPVRVVPAPAGPARSEPPPAAVVSAPPGPDRDVDAGSSPAPVPVPAAEAVPDTVPVVESLPQETDLPAGHGTVQVEGDTTGMYLQRGSSRLPPGGVPSGSYTIVQVVSGAQPVTMGRVEVVAGAVTTV